MGESVESVEEIVESVGRVESVGESDVCGGEWSLCVVESGVCVGKWSLWGRV